MFKKILALTMSAILLSTACGCSFQPDSVKDIISNFTDNKNPYPVQIGHNIIDSAPDTIVVLDNNVADILVTCGYKDKIVGISSDCTQQELIETGLSLANGTLSFEELLKWLCRHC